MADVTVTANEVLEDSGTKRAVAVLGGTVTAGQAIYKTTSGTIAAADAGAASTAECIGIALTGGVTGQPVAWAIDDSTLDPGFTVTVGLAYYLSNTAGGICPVADVVNPMKTVLIGIGITASQLRLRLFNSGVGPA